jgi:aerobic C4-dicarboxylate transport protein
MFKILRNLTFWVLLAIILGICIGHFAPNIAMKEVLASEWKYTFLGQELKIGKTISEMLAGIFISLIKFFINPIIFLTISLGILSMGDLKKVGKIGIKSLVYFEVVTTIALLIGIITAQIFKPGLGISPEIQIIGKSNQPPIVSDGFDWIQFFGSNVTLQVLILAICIGVGLSKLKNNTVFIHFLSKATNIVFGILHKVMLLAPIGAFGGMAFTIGKYGISALIPLGKLMITVYITMFLFIFVVLRYILRYYKISLWAFLRFVREELLIVLGTSSSESALPSLMEKLERMGCGKSVVGLVVPAGYSFNLDGTSIYLSMALIFLAQAHNVELTLPQVITIIGILMVTSKGAAGVTGSGFIVLASTINALNGLIPMEGLALLLGVDRFMSEARSLTNFIGNGAATIWTSIQVNEFDRTKMEIAFSHLERSEDIFIDNLSQ